MIKTSRRLAACLALLLLLSPLHSPAQIGEARRRPQIKDAAATPRRARALGRTARPFRAVPSPAARRYAARELRRMSLDEKIGQLISVGVNASFLNRESRPFIALRKLVEENHVGGIVLFRGPIYESAVLVNRMQSFAARPLLISADLEYGTGMRFEDASSFPWNMAVAATGQTSYARRQGEITATEARALGVQHVFAPVADLNNNAGNPVINVRSYGEDPADAARFVAAYTAGAQSRGVIATAKHFPGHGDTATDSHRGLPVIDVDRARLEGVELVPFRAAIRAGVGSVMIGHIGLPRLDSTSVKPLPRDQMIRPPYVEDGEEVIVENATLPSTLSKVMIDGWLRQTLKFDGMVVTDAMDMSGLTLYFTQAEAAVRAVEAGADMLIKPADAAAMIRGLREAVESKRLSEARVGESAGRVLAAKYDLGLVAERTVALDRIDQVVADPSSLALADEIAERAITLVRDDANLLPLAKEKVRVFNLAMTNGEDRTYVADSFVAAFERERGAIETVVLDERSTAKEVDAALDRARRADVVVASLYGRVRTGQVGSLGVPATGARALNALLDERRKVIGVSFGNPYLLGSFPRLSCYLVAYGDVPSLQRAAARAVAGTIPVTGRLPITLPAPRYVRGTGVQLRAVE